MINLSIEFNGIFVTSENRRYIEDCFQAIFSLSPSESSVFFDFQKEGDEFTGKIRILAQIKNFDVACEANTLNEVMRKLNTEVRNNLKIWKQGRFEVA